MKRSLLYILVILAGFSSCNKDKINEIPKYVVFNAISDGVIVNSVPREIINFFTGDHGDELRLGWDESGYAMRSFLTFKIAKILPSVGEVITIDDVELTVYESNTVLNPFTGDGGSRTVQISLIDYGTLDESDYDAPVIKQIGTLTDHGFNLSEDYSIDVTSAVSAYYNSDPDNIEKLQFRLEFTDDENIIDTGSSELDGSMWNIYAEEEGNYRCELKIWYTHIYEK